MQLLQNIHNNNIVYYGTILYRSLKYYYRKIILTL